MKRQMKMTLFAIALISIAAILTALYLYNMKSKDLTRSSPDLIITARDLQKAFEVDEAGASASYINKIVEVTGSIASVKKADNNVVSISLVTGSDFSSVICTFPAVSDPSVFRVGEEITLRGECSGFLMDVLLNNCAIIKPSRQI